MTTTPGWTTRVRHTVEFLFVAGVSGLLRPCSMETVRRLGEALGRLAFRMAGPRRRIALDNIARAFPEMPAADRERIACGMFEHFGRMLLELVRFGSLTNEQMLGLSDVEGEQYVLQGYAAGKGLIFVGGHFGYWEMQGITHALLWKEVSLMARPLDNPRLHDMLERIRTRTGNAVIYRQGSIRKVLRALGANRGVAILIDQHLHTQEAIQVQFFGRPAATTSVVASLVLRTGALVVPVFGLPLPGGRYRFVYERPVDPPVDDSPAAIHDFTQRCTDVIERYIRNRPDLWLWMHRRWREGSGPLESVEAGRAVHTESGERT
jgi:KDO2-lipid IV(A) lauroyltransferase